MAIPILGAVVARTLAAIGFVASYVIFAFLKMRYHGGPRVMIPVAIALVGLIVLLAAWIL